MTQKAVFASAGACAALLLVASLAPIAWQGWPRRFPPAVVALNAEEDETWRCPVSEMVLLGNFYACPFGPGVKRAEDAAVVLWGDSHAQMYVPALLGQRGLLINANGCAPVLGDAADPNCGAIQRGNYAEILKLPAKTVILAQNWPQYRDEAGDRLGRSPTAGERYGDALRRLRALVSGLRAHGKRVVVVGPVPVPGYEVASIAARDLAFHGRIETPIGVARTEYLAEYANVLSAVADLGRLPTVRIVLMDQWACRGSQCPFVVGGRAVFADHGHYATWFAATLKPAFASALDADGSGAPR